ncbi:tRNA (adenosine(37)-N6)-dimethylallyltransferase MiaA [Candidatus Gottesmanbacteria bacterium]|nr:tRNA (adenosine(37)-N6)-dimethylallyltransferase MiaA [Candidatus Gottesmanbacteria bacterium]
MNKLLVILGPTATGKTHLALKLAQKLNGEIISADSRQVYRGMDIGTGKDKPPNTHIWLYDVVNPNEEFSVADYCQLAWVVIANIWKRGKLPIIVGGTGLYIKAVVDGINTLGIPADEKLREELEGKDIEYLQNKLKEINPVRLENMNRSDRNNSRRLIRAIEIGNKSGINNRKKDIDALFIGLKASREILNKRIDERVDKRVSQGIIQEIRSLLKKGYNWDLPSMSGLGYRQFKEYIEKKDTFDKAVEKWKIAEHQYAKRQMTWFKKDKRILWYDISNYGK